MDQLENSQTNSDLIVEPLDLVEIFNPSGKKVKIEKRQFESALSRGYTVEPPKPLEIESIQPPVKKQPEMQTIDLKPTKINKSGLIIEPITTESEATEPAITIPNDVKKRYEDISKNLNIPLDIVAAVGATESTHGIDKAVEQEGKTQGLFHITKIAAMDVADKVYKDKKLKEEISALSDDDFRKALLENKGLEDKLAGGYIKLAWDKSKGDPKKAYAYYNAGIYSEDYNERQLQNQENFQKKYEQTKKYLNIAQPADTYRGPSSEETSSATPSLIPVYDKEGNLYEIEPEQLDLAIKQEYIPKKQIDEMPDIVDMYDASGKKFGVEKEQIPLALKQKYKFVTPVTAPKAEPKKPIDTTVKDTAIGLANTGFDAFKSLVETGADAATMAAKGATLGWSDELIAATKASVAAPFSDEQLYVLYDKYKKQELDRIKLAEERSPWVGEGAEILGRTIPSALLVAATRGKFIPKKETAEALSTFGSLFGKQGAKVAGLTAGMSAIEGGIGGAGEAKTIADIPSETAKGFVGGGVAGAFLGPVFTYAGNKIPVVKEAINDVIKNNPYLDQIQQAFKAKAAKIPFSFETRQGKQEIRERLNTFANRISSQLMGVQGTLGQKISDVVEEASSNPKIKIDATSGEFQEALSFIEKNLDITNKRIFGNVLYAIRGKSQLDPIVARELQLATRKRLSTMYSSGDINENLITALKIIDDDITNQLIKKVPGFETAVQNYKLFTENTIETILNRGEDITLPIHIMNSEKSVNEIPKRLVRFSGEETGGEVLGQLKQQILGDIEDAGVLGTRAGKSGYTINKFIEGIDQFQKITGIDLKKLGKLNLDFNNKKNLKAGLGIHPDSPESVEAVIMERVERRIAERRSVSRGKGRRVTDIDSDKISQNEFNKILKEETEKAYIEGINKRAKDLGEVAIQPTESYYDLLDPKTLENVFREESNLAGIMTRIEGQDLGHGSEKYSMGYLASRAIGMPLTGARALGSAYRSVKTGVIEPITSSNAIKKLTNASDNVLYKVADSLAGVKGVSSSQANALREAIRSKDIQRKNAVIFAMSQNSAFRDILPSLLEEQEQTETEGKPNE